MKRFLIIFAVFMSLLVPSLVAVDHAAAIDIFPNCGNGSVAGTPAVCQDVKTPGTSNPIIHVIKVLINIISIVIGVAAVIGIVLSGLRMMLANGDANSIASGRNTLLYCLVGLAVAVLAQTIVIVVLDRIK